MALNHVDPDLTNSAAGCQPGDVVACTFSPERTLHIVIDRRKVFEGVCDDSRVQLRLFPPLEYLFSGPLEWFDSSWCVPESIGGEG